VRDLLSDHAGGAPEPPDRPATPAATPLPAPRVSLWQRAAARVSIRLDPSRRAAVAVGLAVLVAAVLTGLWLVAERPRAVAVSASSPRIAGASSPVGTGAPIAAGLPGAGVTPSAAVDTAPSVLVVDVAGKVRRPGLYRLPPGSRVDDAVRAAGGPVGKVDLTRLNLAAKVVDGQQILVGVAGAAEAAPAGGGAAGSGSGAAAGTGGTPVDLNTATLDQLEGLPGIGAVLGQHILDWRAAHGGFNSVDQLNDVSGIGDVKFAALRDLVSV
jgi:competence protein ComEA